MTGRPTSVASSSQRARSASRPLMSPSLQNRIGDRAHRGKARVEAVGRILKHHLDALALRQPRKGIGQDAADLLAIEHDAAGGLVQQPHHHHRGGGFAAAGFADQADAFAMTDRKADAVDRAENLGLGRRLAREQFGQRRRRALARIFLHQLFDQEKRFGGSVYAFLALRRLRKRRSARAATAAEPPLPPATDRARRRRAAASRASVSAYRHVRAWRRYWPRARFRPRGLSPSPRRDRNRPPPVRDHA